MARAPRDDRTLRGRRPDGLDVGSESAGRLSVGSDNRGGLTTVLNVTQQNVSIPRNLVFSSGRAGGLKAIVLLRHETSPAPAKIS
jgi:hypothetical protein